MYVNSVEELHVVLYGHGVAFSQMKCVEGRQVFNSAFCSWLRNKTSVSLACGWTDYINRLAGVKGEEPAISYESFSQNRHHWYCSGEREWKHVINQKRVADWERLNY